MNILITIIRHGETHYNKNGYIQGQYDALLNQDGENQAKLVANRIKKEGEEVSIILSSTLSRAKNTAKEIYNKFENVEYIESELLMERGLGIFETQKYEKLEEKIKNHIKDSIEPKKYHALDKYSKDEKESKIETKDEIDKRIKDAKELILKISNQIYNNSEKPNHIIIVSHGMFLSGLLGHLLNPKEYTPLPCYLKNTSVTKLNLNLKDNSFQLISLNDISHLE